MFLNHSFADRHKWKHSRATSSTGNSSRVSADSMREILEKLKNAQYRPTTLKNYQGIWRRFNRFLVQLDKMPRSWEDRASLFAANMINEGMQSTSIKSYISAIKRILLDDNYEWDDSKILVSTLTRACIIINDSVKEHLPIHCSLLKQILFEIKRKYTKQFYLECLFSALFS